MSVEKVQLPKPLTEIPYSEINDAQKSYSSVSVRVTRRNERGVLATIYNRILKQTQELAEIDGWLGQMAGGGKYTIYASNPENPAQLVLPAFEVNVEGAPRMPLRPDAPHGSVPAYGGGPYEGGSGPQGVPPWAGGTDPMVSGYEQPVVQPTHYHQPRDGGPPRTFRERPAPGATLASDQVLMRQVAEREAEIARLRHEAAERERARDAESKRLQAEIDRIKEDARDRAHKAEMDALRAEMRMSREAGAAPKGLDLDGIAKLVAAVAPILIGKGDAVTQGLAMQQSAMQQTMQLALSQAQRPSELNTILEKYGPMLIPALRDMVTAAQGNPEKEVQLINALAEQQMANVGMMAQMIEQFASDKAGEDHPIVGVIRQGLEGAVAMGQAYLQQKQVEALQQAQQQRAIPADGEVIDERPRQPQHQQQPRPQPQPPRPAPPQNVAAMEPMLAMLPASFQTTEWRALLIALHQQPQVDVESVATLFAHHVQHLLVFQMLPVELSAITTDPRGTLTTMLQFMPIAQTAPQYAKAIVDRVVELLVLAGVAAPQHAPNGAPPASAPQPQHDDEVDDGEGDDEDELETYPAQA